MTRMFKTLCLEISSLCNRFCEFCPVAYNRRPDEPMKRSTLLKVLDELGAMKYNKRIELYLYNEPMRDKEYLLEAIALARSKVPKACLMIATNGDYLKGTEDILQLYAAGLNQLLINCYSPHLYAKRLPWVEALPKDIHRDKSMYAVMSCKSRSVAMLDKSDVNTFGKGVFGLMNRAGNIPSFLPNPAKPVERMCTKPFRTMVVNWKGEALICCNDYHGEVVTGNVKDSTLAELWHSPVLNEYRRRLYGKDRSLPLCRRCDCHSGAYPHNVERPTGPFATKQEVERHYKEKRNASTTILFESRRRAK